MRLDQFLVQNNYFESRNKAQYEIENGNVLVNNIPILKCSYDVDSTDSIYVIKEEELKYVSKGGLKLERAMSYFNIDCNNKICCDIGSSTGGFTDYLIQNNAKLVYSIDVGKDQLHKSLRSNPKIKLFEQTNFLNIDLNIIKDTELFVIDVSFTKIEPILKHIIDNFNSFIVVFLIKPQFELGKLYLKNGVVKDSKLHDKVLLQIKEFISMYSLHVNEIIESPIKGGSGNKEFLTYIKK